MNKILTFILPLCAVLAACDSQKQATDVDREARAGDKGATAFIPGCPSGPTATECPPGLEKRNKIKIQVTPSGINVAPPMVCAERGTMIMATVEVAESITGDVLVATVPKNGGRRRWPRGWLNRSDNCR